ncbi:hypothetical protein DFH28DRAFT_855716, partial [Melampsora americana]
ADPRDPSLKPYACAYRACCDQRPRVSFNTCGELLSHWRETHESFRGTDPLERPFMCVMNGCMRDWKNIAGIRYHIQTATDHFITDPITLERTRNLQSEQKPIQRGPISSSRPTGMNLLSNPNFTTQPHPLPPVTTISNPTTTTTTTTTTAKKKQSSSKSRKSNRSDEKNAARKYLCPIEGCEKRYQQTSGLKYHLSNGPEHSAKLHREGISIDGLIATSTLNMLKSKEI